MRGAHGVRQKDLPARSRLGDPLTPLRTALLQGDGAGAAQQARRRDQGPREAHAEAAQRGERTTLRRREQPSGLTSAAGFLRTCQSREEMEARIEQLEYRRTTTSMSLQDEKSLLREIDNLKKSIKCLAVVDEALELLNSKRDQRSACHDRIRVLSSALQEFTAGIKRMELAERLGVSSVDLQSVDVEVPAEKAGELVGRGGQNMRRLQEECGVSAQLDSKTEQETVQLHLEGTPQGLAMALERVNRISATVTQEVTLTPAQRSMLVMNRAAVLQELSGHFNVRMDLRGGVRRREGGVDEPTVVEITGVPDAIDALKAYLDSPDFAGEERIDFDLEQVARVVGKGGENLKKIQAEYKVDLDIDRSTGHVVLRGSPLEVTRARSGVLEMLRGVQDVEEIIVITNPAHVSALLDNQGYVPRRKARCAAASSKNANGNSSSNSNGNRNSNGNSTAEGFDTMAPP
eukprot:scaffold48_cov311-Pinguiococcus_pyrenoidosus.AAC.106